MGWGPPEGETRFQPRGIPLEHDFLRGMRSVICTEGNTNTPERRGVRGNMLSMGPRIHSGALDTNTVYVFNIYLYFNMYEHFMLSFTCADISLINIINSFNHLVFVDAVYQSQNTFFPPHLLESIYIATLIVINSETKCIHLLSSAHLSLYLS